MVCIRITVDFERGPSGHLAGELSLSNWNEQVKIEANSVVDGPIYIERGDLLRALAALEAGSD